jgi:hypothetical protein
VAGRVPSGLVWGGPHPPTLPALRMEVETSDAQSVDKERATEPPAFAAMRPSRPSSPPSSPQRALPISVGTANVQTLKPKEEALSSARVCGVLLLGKIQILEARFHEHHLDAVMIQEGRSRTMTSKNGSYYAMYAGAADPGGNYGPQIWIAKQMKYIPSSFLQHSHGLCQRTV